MIILINVKAIYLVDPDNKESITSLECVFAVRKSIKLYSIIKSEVIAKKLFENKVSNNIVLVITPTSFINNINTY